jgi:hypothetical protein
MSNSTDYLSLKRRDKNNLSILCATAWSSG